jgi:hypothetical protein
MKLARPSCDRFSSPLPSPASTITSKTPPRHARPLAIATSARFIAVTLANSCCTAPPDKPPRNHQKPCKTFIRLMNSEVAKIGSVRAFLYRITNNLSIDHTRHNSVRGINDERELQILTGDTPIKNSAITSSNWNTCNA